MAGRHGVPAPERRTHARGASGQRRNRARRRDAAQPWAAWLAVRGVIVIAVLVAMAYSGLLVHDGRGGIWPVVALAAGALSVLMIGLDVRARVRQRRRWRLAQALPTEPHLEPLADSQPESHQELPADSHPELSAAPAGFVPEPPPPPRRSSHRK
jgi:hypothetical protein